MGDTRERELIQFITYINNLETTEFAGIVKILCVAFTNDGKTVRPYEEILSDLIDNFCNLGKRQRREIMKLLRQVEKDRKKEVKKINATK